MKDIKLKDKIAQGINDLFYIWKREFQTTFRDQGVLIFFILVPLGYPLLYSFIYDNEVVREVPAVVVDDSHSSLSREYLRKVDATPDIQIVAYCADMEEAKQMLKNRLAYGIIYIPSDFSDNIAKGKQTQVSIYCDMSLMLTYKAIYQSATAVSMEMNKEIQKSMAMGSTKRDEEISTQPLAVDELPLFNTTGGYGNAILPGVLILILQQTLLLGIGLSAGTARENNRYQDLVPISKHYNGIFKIVLGKSSCYFMIYCVIGAYLTLAVPKLFSFTMLARPSDLIGLMIPYLLAIIFFGMTISCMVRYRENVILLVVFTSVPFLFLTGLSWPENNIPGLWQGISWLIPSTYGVRGFLRLSSMGATLQDIRFEYQALWMQTVVYFFLTCLVYRYQIISARKHALEHVRSIQDKIKKARNQRSNG